MTNETRNENEGIWKIQRMLKILGNRHRETEKIIEERGYYENRVHTHYLEKLDKLLGRSKRREILDEMNKKGICSLGLRQSKEFSSKRAQVKKILKNLQRTFGTAQEPIGEIENMINSNYQHVWSETRHSGSWHGVGSPFQYEYVEYRNSTMPSHLTVLLAGKDEFDLIKDRKMTREQFEGIVLRTMREGPRYPIPMGVDDMAYSHRRIDKEMQEVFEELTRTPYSDRAIIGTQEQTQFEMCLPKEVTEKEWKKIKLNVLKPTEERK